MFLKKNNLFLAKFQTQIMMRKNFFYLFFIILALSSCRKDEKGFSLLRKYYSNAYTTYKGADLHTACLEETWVTGENGKPIRSPYWAMLQGEFTDVEDTIVQYGHVWSLDNPTPYILKDDTTNYTKNGVRDYGEIGTFVSVIPDLMPETPYFARSYIITINGDTGYNKSVFIDTTISPVNEWFRKADFIVGQNNAREGVACFTMLNEEKGYECAYLLGGFDGFQCNRDFFEYDPRTDSWMQLFSINQAVQRTEAVAVSITTYDKFGKIQIRGYAGLGRDINNNKLNDWWEYIPLINQWQEKTNYPRTVSSAVAFAIGEKAFVGTGSTTNDILVSEFYSYNPYADSIGGTPWKQITKFANNESMRRKNAVSFVVNDYGFVGLGEGENGTYFKDLWLFAPGDEIQSYGYWIEKEGLPDTIQGRTNAVGFSVEAQGYIGMGFDGEKSLQDLWRYDPFNDRWAQCADYKTGPHYVEGDPKYIRNAIGFGIEDRGYVGLGFKSENEEGNKYSYELWVYRPW